MKYSVASHCSSQERIAEPLLEDPVRVWPLSVLTGAVNLIGRNEILHLFLAAIVAAVAIIL